MRIFNYFTFLFLVILSPSIHAQRIDVYYINMFRNETETDSLLYTSLSDNYKLSEHPDSLAIPFIENREEKDVQYIRLDSIYRNRFLSKMKISDNDKVFIYDYYTNVLQVFPVKELQVVACLNIYGADWPYSQTDYRIGFMFNEKSLKDSENYFGTSLVYVGKKSPFVKGKMTPIVWEKVESETLPLIPISSNDSLIVKELKNSDAYTYKTKKLQYFVQDFVGENYCCARRLLVMETRSQKIICDQLYRETESSSLASLSNQLTGKLFKNKPLVIFGFYYSSYDCPVMTFLNNLNNYENDVYFNCDNRH